MKTYTSEQKLNQCKRVVTDLLAACGEQDMPALVTEAKEQAVAPGYLTKALNELKRDGVICFDAEYQTFDLN